MQHEGGGERRRVGVVGDRGYGLPLPFASSVSAPELSLPRARRRRWLRARLTGGVAVVVAAAVFLATGSEARPARPMSAAEAMTDVINDGLDAQGRALLAGDLDGFLAYVDVPLRDEFTLRFHSLRALGVARWTARVTTMPPDVGATLPVPATVTIGYCLGDADCEPAELVLTSRWTVQDGRALATRFQRTVLPWDLTPLRAVAGRRVVLAAPVSVADDLRPVLEAADQAADRADRFARWGAPPKRYVVYLAGPEQWGTWFGGPAEWAAGYAVGPHGVTLRVDQIGRSGLVHVLAHEFTHVVSLGRVGRARWEWWLSEGLAEYVADWDGSVTRNRLPSMGYYLRAGHWDDAIALGSMPADASDAERSARYGIALLAVTCLARRFGEDRMLAFFGAVVRERSTPETAAPTALGAQWAPTAAACAAEVRTRVRDEEQR